jgi:hypothetical protein
MRRARSGVSDASTSPRFTSSDRFLFNVTRLPRFCHQTKQLAVELLGDGADGLFLNIVRIGKIERIETTRFGVDRRIFRGPSETRISGGQPSQARPIAVALALGHGR